MLKVTASRVPLPALLRRGAIIFRLGPTYCGGLINDTTMASTFLMGYFVNVTGHWNTWTNLWSIQNMANYGGCE